MTTQNDSNMNYMELAIRDVISYDKKLERLKRRERHRENMKRMREALNRLRCRLC